MGAIENTLAFIFVLGVMVVIHELGHFLAAIYFNVKVEAFSVGFGPRLFGFKRGETDYRVCVLPIGGYVKMAGDMFGESTGDSSKAKPGEFLSKPRWQRLIILFMGPAFNVVLAVALLAGLYLFHYERAAFWVEPAVISAVAEDSAAEKAGIQAGDKILTFDGVETPNWESVKLAEVTAVHRDVEVQVERNASTVDLVVSVSPDQNGLGSVGWEPATDVQLQPLAGTPAERAGIQNRDVVKAIDGRRIREVDTALELIRGSEGRELQFELERAGRSIRVVVSPEFDETSSPDDPAYRIGAGIGHKTVVQELNVGEAIVQSSEDNYKNASLILGFLKGLFERRQSAGSLQGPVGIARMSGEAARRGWTDLVNLMANISLNLGIFNLLPIPILDGGGILLLLVESVIRRDVSLAIKERIVQVGLVFLVLLFTFVMYNDILKELPGG